MTWEQVAGLILLAGFLITTVTTIVKFTDRLTKAEGALESAKEAKAIAELAERDLAAFKEKVARDYVTNSTILQFEERLVGAINRLGDRLDRVLEMRSPATRPPRSGQ